MSYVFDSSSLIYLGKLKLLGEISSLKGEKFIPREVYEEVMTKGFERNEPEVNEIVELIDNKQLIIKDIEINIADDQLLSKADQEVISLAKKTKSTAIINEIYGKQIAKSYNIECHGSLYVLIKLIEKRSITKKQAVDYIDKMIELGFYLSINKYKEILQLIKDMK